MIITVAFTSCSAPEKSSLEKIAEMKTPVTVFAKRTASWDYLCATMIVKDGNGNLIEFKNGVEALVNSYEVGDTLKY